MRRKSIQDMLAKAREIQNAGTSENTAERVGRLFEDIISSLSTPQFSGLLSSLSALNNPLDANQMLKWDGSYWYYGDIPTGGSGSGMTTTDMWDALRGSSTEQIDYNHLTGAFDQFKRTLPTGQGIDLTQYTWWGNKFDGNGKIINGAIEFSNGVKIETDGDNSLKVVKNSSTQANLWASGGISAMGAGSSGGGGGTSTLGDLLNSLNDAVISASDISGSSIGDIIMRTADGWRIGSPASVQLGWLSDLRNNSLNNSSPTNGQTIQWDNSLNSGSGGWKYATISSGSGGGGTVESVGLESHIDAIEVGGTNPITGLGIFSLNLNNDYVIPKKEKADLWDQAVGLSGKVAELEEHFLPNGIAKLADELNKTCSLWGQDFNGTQDVSGTMKDVGSITMNGNIVMSASNAIEMQPSGTLQYYISPLSDSYLTQADYGTVLGMNSTNLHLGFKTRQAGYGLQLQGKEILFTVDDTENGIYAASVEESGQFYIRSGKGLRIGEGVLTWDSTTNSLKVEKYGNNGNTPANFYATGGVSAMDAPTSQSDSVESLNVGTLNGTRANEQSYYVRDANGADKARIYYNNAGNANKLVIGGADNDDEGGIGHIEVNKPIKMTGENSVTSSRFYFDDNHYLFIGSNGTLKYNNNGTEKTVVLQ